MKFFIKIIKRTIIAVLLLTVLAGLCETAVLVYRGHELFTEVTAECSLEEKVRQVRQKQHYTALHDLPEIYTDAVIAVEDSRFYKHGGVDLLSIARAVWHNIQAGKFIEGGSTITQQLAKNLYFTQEKVMLRKVAEMFVAFELEKNYSKDEILELYVNSIYFGNGYYSVYEASMGYYEKAPSDMSDYESTLLAGIPNAPSVYALTNRPELAAQRQKKVLAQMVEENYLTREQAERILEEK